MLHLNSRKRKGVFSVILGTVVFLTGCATMNTTTTKKKVFSERAMQGYPVEMTGDVGVISNTTYTKEVIHPSGPGKLVINVDVKGKHYNIMKRDRGWTTPMILLPFAKGTGTPVPGPDADKEILTISVFCDEKEAFSERYSFKDMLQGGANKKNSFKFQVGPLTAGAFDVGIEVSPMWEEKEKRGLVMDALYMKGLWVNLKIHALPLQQE